MRPYRWLTLAAGVVLIALFLLPALLRSREKSPPNPCLRNMHMLTFAMRMYAVDGDGHLPPADRWASCLVPSYISEQDILKCPNDASAGRCSYGMNSALSAKAVASIRDDGSAVLLYETGYPRNVPFGGPEDTVIPPRHPWGNNYGYLDGSVVGRRDPPSFAVE